MYVASALGLALIIFFVNSLFALNRPYKPATRNTGQLLRYSLPVHLGWVFNTIRGTLEVIVLGFVGLTTGVGIFAVAQRLSSLGTLLFFLWEISQRRLLQIFTIEAILANLKSFIKQLPSGWLCSTSRSSSFLSSLQNLFYRYLALISPWVQRPWSSWRLAILFYTGTGFGANILDMTNHTKFNSANSAFLVVVTIAFDLLFIPRWGVMGAAAASAFSTVIVNVACLIEVFFLLKMHPYRRDVWKPIIAVSISALITLHSINIWFSPPYFIY